MAKAPAHRFGQILGELLEEILEPALQTFCNERGLFLDKRGERAHVRSGKKLSWQDKYENEHDLDFVIEKGGTASELGRPVAFVECAWRRYTKHSRNKAQEIQGAILPISEKYPWDKPFLGVVLAGLFTEGSLRQMKSSGFQVMLFSYESVVAAFASVGIVAAFEEDTPDAEFAEAVEKIKASSAAVWTSLKDHLMRANSDKLSAFLDELRATLDRVIERILLVPLHGEEMAFTSVTDASAYLGSYVEAQGQGKFKKYEVIVRFSNGDSIDAMFQTKKDVLRFFDYVST